MQMKLYMCETDACDECLIVADYLLFFGQKDNNNNNNHTNYTNLTSSIEPRCS